MAEGDGPPTPGTVRGLTLPSHLMAVSIPTCEPYRLRAGDTWRWQRSLTDYPAPTWSLYYVLLPKNGDEHRIEVNASANGSYHEVNVASASTSNYAAGEYVLTAYVSDGTNRYTLDDLSGTVVNVLADPAKTFSSDRRTTAEKILAKLETAAESLSTGTIKQASENGKSYTVHDMSELQRDIGYWRNVVWAERSRARLRTGKSNLNIIRTKFVAPR